MVANQDEGWRVGTFARDTLIYLLGALAASILKRAASEPDFEAVYQSWLGKAAADSSLADRAEPLLTTGIGEGTATLLARSREGEFCLHCEHPGFDALVAVGFDVARMDLEGVLIARFEGDGLAAIAFARALARDVDRHLTEPAVGSASRRTCESIKN